jgi:hypothetical protein
MTTFYLTDIKQDHNAYDFTLVNNSNVFIIKYNYGICFIYCYINGEYVGSFDYNHTYKLPEISNHSISSLISLTVRGFESMYFTKSEIIHYSIYFNRIKPLLDSIILKKRLYELFIFKLVFKDKLTNDIYQYAIRFL